MPQVILTVAKDLKGHEKFDLTFNIRPHAISQKWLQCLSGVEHRAPWKWGFTASADDLPRVEARIRKTLLESELVNTYLSDFITDGDIIVTQDVVNATHRFVEDHKSEAAWHLQLHNDIHYWEGIQKGDARPGWHKIIWNPPGDYLHFDETDYALYNTDYCDNFLALDFAHVGRDPFNSYHFRDDLKLSQSCVMQNAVSSGFKWIKYDDSHKYTEHETEFRAWVRDHLWYFSDAGITDEYDPRLCFGRIILADGQDTMRVVNNHTDHKFIIKVTTVQ